MTLTHKILNKLPFFLCLIVLFELLFLYNPPQIKAATLLGPSDYIPDDTLSETGVVHNVGFLIPPTGHTIVATDYIRIVMTNFSSVTAPTSGSGWGGSPTFGATGNVAWVTGVTAGPNTGIGISGMTATNPADPSDFDITIEIANDVGGSIVYDSATTTAQVLKRSLTASVTIGVPTTSVEFIGYTSPSAFVTILLNGGVAGTKVANGGGNFQKLISGLTPDINYSVSIFAVDTDLRQTQTVSFIIHTLPNTTLIVSNIVIPTTISLDDTQIYQGDSLVVRGRGHPVSQITVFVPPYADVVQSGTNGRWSYSFDSFSNPLDPGLRTAYGKEVVVGGYESILTHLLQFQVLACGIADLNCDGHVNLTDFSILMFYWHQIDPVNARADINGDHYVDLIDFSIMMFYWTG